MQYGAEEARSCLNTFRFYLKKQGAAVGHGQKKKGRASRAKDDSGKAKLREELTVNIASVRGVEFIARAFCISHHDFKGES